jgi:hypothetical protein
LLGQIDNSEQITKKEKQEEEGRISSGEELAGSTEVGEASSIYREERGDGKEWKGRVSDQILMALMLIYNYIYTHCKPIMSQYTY